MKSTACFALMALCLSAVFGGEKNEELAFDGGQKLEINLKTGGNLHVEGWDQDTLSVTYNMRGDESVAVVKISDIPGGKKISCKPKAKSWRSSIGINMTIKVPQNTDLDIYSSGGKIELTGLDGSFEGKTMGGALILEDLAGRASLKTMGGNVRVSNSELDGRVETMGGNIRFSDVVGNIDGKTMGGNVTYNNVRLKNRGDNGNSPEDVVNILTMGGEIEVEDAPLGAKVKTMGGDIEIGKAAVFVQATTMGGDIEIEEINGWVEAKTMGGDVTVKMVGDPRQGRRDVDISSKGGDILLYLPAGLSVDFDVKLDFTKNSRKNYKIVSDFPIETHETENWSYKRGNPRKTIVGNGASDGGKHKIKIRTINGNVEIRQSR